MINCCKKPSYPIISMFYLINVSKNLCISMGNSLKTIRIIEKNLDNGDIFLMSYVSFYKNKIIKNNNSTSCLTLPLVNYYRYKKGDVVSYTIQVSISFMIKYTLK